VTGTELEYLGLDIGSTTVKGVVAGESGGAVRSYIAPVSGDYAADIARARAELFPEGAPARIVATGYGRDLVHDADKTVSEISCHARGAHFLFPDARLVIDIGGQDVKAIRLGEGGRPLNFQMNDRCAAGTGRFLDVMAKALGVPVGELSALADGADACEVSEAGAIPASVEIESGAAVCPGESDSTSARKSGSPPVRISNMCAVFAESEVISLLSRGTPKSAIAAALIESAAERIATLAARVAQPSGAVPMERVVVFSGGGARNARLAKSVGDRLKCNHRIPADPELIGALGSAIVARTI